ncbi:signal peptidase I [Alicyclobacillus suci]|uniref:signal peptidase I n=1 Tax=Alicyclobacillus suci TaxID=2816080 RepID=UPI001A901E28|nr:signal peptidase I [Alicyclobacillus suci]
MRLKQHKHSWLKEWVLPIGVGVVVAFGLKTWVVSAAVVPSSSMYPTIPATETHHVYILDNKLATDFGRKIYRGEVVVFHFPDNPKELYVKRVIGLPGDTVEVTANAVYINGKKLNESNQFIAKSNELKLGIYHVPAGHYFMLGDNRTVSIDSRYWVHKYVARSAIIGEADFVIAPISDIGPISQSLSASNGIGDQVQNAV